MQTGQLKLGQMNCWSVIALAEEESVIFGLARPPCSQQILAWGGIENANLE